MNGSRLGRGRGGRLALYGGSMVILVLLVFLYRAATTEMTRLRELNVECSHQQKAQATQLQVIFEYKVGLEKSLSEEKNSNLALKRELERATREKTLRDKDSIKEIQRFNSLQQQHKILQSENQDLRDEISKARDDKEKSMEHLKNQYLEIEMEKTKFEEKYNDLLKTNGNTDSTIQHLNKQIFQLKRELDDAKLSCRSTLSGNNVLNQRTKESAQSPALPHVEKSVSTSQQLQVSQASNNVDGNPPPIRAPPNHQPIFVEPLDDNNNQDEKDRKDNIGFIQKNNEVVEPAGASDIEAENEMKKNILPPYIIKRGPFKNEDPMKPLGNEDENGAHEIGSDQNKLVLVKPYVINKDDEAGNGKLLLKSDNDKFNVPDEKQRNIESPLFNN